jgi:hypothetical protein
MRMDDIDVQVFQVEETRRHGLWLRRATAMIGLITT